MTFLIEPVARVSATRQVARDDYWGGEIAEIVLADSIDSSALAGLDAFSHAEILFVFHGVPEDKIVTGARHPRNNEAWPEVGIFAQRGKNRPNRIGSTICRILSVEGRVLRVAELDAIDGTPVIDIKPVMHEFLPRGSTHQPDWATELMSEYWADCSQTEQTLGTGK
ncbi:SAM-dependent methyltransferase [Burkholderiaceae bacterium DAT-1]|nr:SAM-dependent methyltransferase [Burkholderiaceae bacterium DAT-1]